MSKVKALFAAAGRQYKAVEIDGETVYIGKLSIAVREKYTAVINESWNKAMAVIIQFCTYDDDAGTRSFGDTEDDLAAIMAAPQEIIDKLANEIRVFNGIGIEADPVKEAAKN